MLYYLLIVITFILGLNFISKVHYDAKVCEMVTPVLGEVVGLKNAQIHYFFFNVIVFMYETEKKKLFYYFVVVVHTSRLKKNQLIIFYKYLLCLVTLF